MLRAIVSRFDRKRTLHMALGRYSRSTSSQLCTNKLFFSFLAQFEMSCDDFPRTKLMIGTRAWFSVKNGDSWSGNYTFASSKGSRGEKSSKIVIYWGLIKARFYNSRGSRSVHLFFRCSELEFRKETECWGNALKMHDRAARFPFSSSCFAFSTLLVCTFRERKKKIIESSARLSADRKQNNVSCVYIKLYLFLLSFDH